jgi:hypothetical protein
MIQAGLSKIAERIEDGSVFSPAVLFLSAGRGVIADNTANVERSSL